MVTWSVSDVIHSSGHSQMPVGILFSAKGSSFFPFEVSFTVHKCTIWILQVGRLRHKMQGQCKVT